MQIQTQEEKTGPKCIWCGCNINGYQFDRGGLCNYCYNNVWGALIDWQKGVIEDFPYDIYEGYAFHLRQKIRSLTHQGLRIMKPECSFCHEDNVCSKSFFDTCQLCYDTVPGALLGAIYIRKIPVEFLKNYLLNLQSVLFNLEIDQAKKARRVEKEKLAKIEATKDDEIVILKATVEQLRKRNEKLEKVNGCLNLSIIEHQKMIDSMINVIWLRKTPTQFKSEEHVLPLTAGYFLDGIRNLLFPTGGLKFKF